MVMPVIQYAPETCAWCRGAGKWGEYGDSCLICGGQGSLLVAQPARQCPWCEGKGVVGELEDRCKTCGGSGWSHVLSKQATGR
jgi:DnaJ-class molecular chaperone